VQEIHPASSFPLPLPTGGFAQVRPTTDFVGGAWVETGIDESLDQCDGIAPTLFPVLGEPSQHELHKAANEVGIMAIGHDQQTRVIGQQGAAAAALLSRPTDELISIFNVKGGGNPGGYGEPLALVNESVAQMLTPPASRRAGNGVAGGFDRSGRYPLGSQAAECGRVTRPVARREKDGDVCFYACRQSKKVRRGCSEKSAKLFVPNMNEARRDASYEKGV
jgi:hypothetical protein